MSAKIEATGHNQGVTNVLSPDESQESIKHAVKMWKARNKLSDKIGKGKFALVVYEKIKRITVPMGNKHLIYITADLEGGHYDVIESVLNLIPGTKPFEFLETKAGSTEDLPEVLQEAEPQVETPKENKPELADPLYWRPREEKLVAYEKDYLERLEKEQKKAERIAKTKAAKSKKEEEPSSSTHETLPKGYKPTPEPEPEPAKRSDRGLLPKGF